MTSRRQFFRYGSLLAAGAVLSSFSLGAMRKSSLIKEVKQRLSLRFMPYELRLKHQFSVSGNSRIVTPVVLVEVEYDGVIGYGEASMPPYLGETQQSVMDFLSKVNISRFSNPFDADTILDYLDSVADNNYAAKASVDIALHDLVGKLKSEPYHRMIGVDASKSPHTSFTIGIDTSEIIRKKVEEAEPYKILKVKLGRNNDKEIVETIRSVTDKPLCVDVNQGWTDKYHALDMINWLAAQGVTLVEQPMPKHDHDSHAWLTEKSPIPVVADEAVQVAADILPLKGVYSGINIKLMKCGGLRNALRMIDIARKADMKVMIGCMTETSCAVSAAAQLSPLVDYADLDGNLLIDNDLFDGVKVIEGRIVLRERAGIGVEKLKIKFEI